MPVLPKRLRDAITIGKAKFYAFTLEVTLDPGEKVTMNVSPAMLELGPEVVWVHYCKTLGGVTFPDIRIGFWSSHRMMVYHWNPMVESVFNYPRYYNVATAEDSPEVMIFYNPTDTALTFKMTVWIAEFPSKSAYQEYEEVIRGEWNLLRMAGRIRADEFEAMIEGLAKIAWVFDQYKREELLEALAKLLKIKIPELIW